ncbi:hypothetical protein ACOJ2L_19940, partial [Bacillus pumilus]
TYPNAGWSTHYYALVPVTFTSNDIQLSSNVPSVYPLAYTSRYYSAGRSDLAKTLSFFLIEKRTSSGRKRTRLNSGHH